MKFIHCIFCILVLVFIFSFLVKFSQKKWNYIQEGNTDCQTTSYFETAVSDHEDYCNDLSLQNVHIKNGTSTIYLYSTDKNINTTGFFDLTDANGNNITGETLGSYTGDIGFDILDTTFEHDDFPNGINIAGMDDISVNSGIKTDCGLKWILPVHKRIYDFENETSEDVSACNFYFGINETD